MSQSVLSDRTMALLLFAVLIKRLGNNVTITQSDIDAVAYSRLDERLDSELTVHFQITERTSQ